VDCRKFGGSAGLAGVATHWLVMNYIGVCEILKQLSSFLRSRTRINDTSSVHRVLRAPKQTEARARFCGAKDMQCRV